MYIGVVATKWVPIRLSDELRPLLLKMAVTTDHDAFLLGTDLLYDYEVGMEVNKKGVRFLKFPAKWGVTGKAVLVPLQHHSEEIESFNVDTTQQRTQFI